MVNLKFTSEAIEAGIHRQALYKAVEYAQMNRNVPELSIQMLEKARKYQQRFNMSPEIIERDMKEVKDDAIKNGLNILPDETIYHNVFRYVLGSRILINIEARGDRYPDLDLPELEAIADAVRQTRDDAAGLGVNIDRLIASLIP